VVKSGRGRFVGKFDQPVRHAYPRGEERLRSGVVALSCNFPDLLIRPVDLANGPTMAMQRLTDRFHT
jgi:hypothetical protein